MGYEIISDIGNMLINLLRDQLVPEVITNADGIGLCSPDEKGDFSLCIYLYDIKESEEVVSSGMINDGIKGQRYPSAYINLFYMITAYSNSDIKFRAVEEQKILGKVIQTFWDYSYITNKMIQDRRTDSISKVRIELQQIEQYEKIRLWNFPNVPYKLSLFYKVFPAEIPSSKKREVTRIVDVNFISEEKS